ncbi:MAG: hypothetical protein MUF63_10010 [Rhodobacteraceae bacterium]|nr:hypothetical protein [Paracoccaceae bacterium]
MPAARALVAAAALLTLAACAERADLNEPVVPIGDFRLGHNVVVAKDTTEGPFSRDATEQELEAALSSEIEHRLRRYDGDGLYHIGVRIEAFVLGQPGIPILLSPQSVLILAVNIWDNETRERLNAEPIRVTAFEALNTRVPILSSGLVNSKEEQLENLSISAALQIEQLLRENEATWFAPKPDRVRVEFTPGTPLTAEQQATAQSAIDAANASLGEATLPAASTTAPAPAAPVAAPAAPAATGTGG